MKVILVARKALAAYLISSLVSRLVNRIGRLVEIERAIDFAHHLAGAFGIAAHHHPVGAAEILQRRTFAQEFRIGRHVELGIGALLADDLFHLAAGADRHGGFGHHHGIAGQGVGDFLGGGEDIGQIGMAVAAAAGRAHRDEHGLRVRHRGLQIGGEGQAAGLGVDRHHIVQPRLKDRNAAGPQGLDLARILVDADHLMAEFRQTGAGYKAHITRADDGDAHGISKIMCLFLARTDCKYKRVEWGTPNLSL